MAAFTLVLQHQSSWAGGLQGGTCGHGLKRNFGFSIKFQLKGLELKNLSPRSRRSKGQLNEPVSSVLQGPCED